MLCATNRNMFAGCLSESNRHKKTHSIEQDILRDHSPNAILAPLLASRTTPINLREFRQGLQHLPTLYDNKGRDDFIYGAARYTANTLGFRIDSENISENIDPRPSEAEVNRKWRMAIFRCRCKNMEHTQDLTIQFGPLVFCQTCKFLVYKTCLSTTLSCPTCNVNEAWQESRNPCLSCQFAAIVYQNSFQSQLDKQLELWLAQEPSDSSESDANRDTIQQAVVHTSNQTFQTDSELLRRRNQAIEDSFQEMRSRATPEQTRIVFENLSILQQSLQNSWDLPKRPHDNAGNISSLTQTSNE